jgi:hypothetical protein
MLNLEPLEVGRLRFALTHYFKILHNLTPFDPNLVFNTYYYYYYYLFRTKVQHNISQENYVKHEYVEHEKKQKHYRMYIKIRHHSRHKSLILADTSAGSIFQIKFTLLTETTHSLQCSIYRLPSSLMNRTLPSNLHHALLCHLKLLLNKLILLS